jgi:hypothetical protein
MIVISFFVTLLWVPLSLLTASIDEVHHISSCIREHLMITKMSF